jgi:hypothetical protein
MMRKLILVAAAVLGLALTTTGCTHIRSAAGGNSTMANDAWFTQTTGLGPFLVLSSKVYYCPPMGSGGASTCMEAEMIESGQPAAPAGGGMSEAPPPAPAEDTGMGGEPMMEGDEGGYE